MIYFAFLLCEWTLGYKHTEHQVAAAAARSHSNTFAAPLDAPNRSQIHCLNLTLTMILTFDALLDAQCVYTLKCALQIFKQQLTFKTRKRSRISIVLLQTSLYCDFCDMCMHLRVHCPNKFKTTRQFSLRA